MFPNDTTESLVRDYRVGGLTQVMLRPMIGGMTAMAQRVTMMKEIGKVVEVEILTTRVTRINRQTTVAIESQVAVTLNP